MKPVYCYALGGALLIVLAGAALLNPFRWIGLGDLLWLWPMVAALGLALLTGACARAAFRGRDLWRRCGSALAAAILAMAALASAGFGSLILLFTDMDKRVVAVSADGRFEILVHETSNVIDPVEAMYVQSTSGPFSRRAFLGCRNGDHSALIESVRFTGPNSVLVKTGEQWTVTFDPDKVRAGDTLPEDACLKNLYTG